jgi:hypothetical protein
MRGCLVVKETQGVVIANVARRQPEMKVFTQLIAPGRMPGGSMGVPLHIPKKGCAVGRLI